MSTTVRITTSVRIAGVTLTSVVNRTEEASELISIDLEAGLAGVLATRTSDDVGIITVATGHGVTVSDIVSVFFADGVKYDCVVTGTTATTISISSSTGDILPVVTSDVVVGVQQSNAVLIAGDNLVAMVIRSTQRALSDFRNVSPASVLAYDIPANEGRIWVSDSDVTNPLAGESVVTVHVANGGTSATTVEIGLLKSTA